MPGEKRARSIQHQRPHPSLYSLLLSQEQLPRPFLLRRPVPNLRSLPCLCPLNFHTISEYEKDNSLFDPSASASSTLTEDSLPAGTDPLLEDARPANLAGTITLGDGPGESATTLSRSSAAAPEFWTPALPLDEATAPWSCLRFRFRLGLPLPEREVFRVMGSLSLEARRAESNSRLLTRLRLTWRHRKGDLTTLARK